MAEKKLTKKFGQKRDFKSEEKKTKNNTYMKKKTLNIKKFLLNN